VSQDGPVGRYVREHFLHFNAAALVDAADAWRAHVVGGGRMMVTLAGAMSTARLGQSLAPLIRDGWVHAISTTGANLEEDLFQLLAGPSYERLPHYRDLTKADEAALLARGMNRVTDTAIPEEAALRPLERHLMDAWRALEAGGERRFPHEVLYDLIRSGHLDEAYQRDPADSWLVAAAEAGLPIVTPGWEDSTTGNMYAAALIRGDLHEASTVKSGVEAMVGLADWYTQASREGPVGMFQIGGGIAGDFPICVVPMLNQDVGEWVPTWSYFAQVSDSTTSYGSYSGAVPNEKITWGKLTPEAPSFVIESDATIVAPLVFALLAGA
jgi:deoxyhypusine synthase